MYITNLLSPNLSVSRALNSDAPYERKVTLTTEPNITDGFGAKGKEGKAEDGLKIEKSDIPKIDEKEHEEDPAEEKSLPYMPLRLMTSPSPIKLKKIKQDPKLFQIRHLYKSWVSKQEVNIEAIKAEIKKHLKAKTSHLTPEDIQKMLENLKTMKTPKQSFKRKKSSSTIQRVRSPASVGLPYKSSRSKGLTNRYSIAGSVRVRPKPYGRKKLDERKDRSCPKIVSTIRNIVQSVPMLASPNSRLRASSELGKVVKTQRRKKRAKHYKSILSKFKVGNMLDPKQGAETIDVNDGESTVHLKLVPRIDPGAKSRRKNASSRSKSKPTALFFSTQIEHDEAPQPIKNLNNIASSRRLEAINLPPGSFDIDIIRNNALKRSMRFKGEHLNLEYIKKTTLSKDDQMKLFKHYIKSRNLLQLFTLLEEEPEMMSLRDSHGRLLLHWAAFYQNLELVRFLVQRGVKDRPDVYGVFALDFPSKRSKDYTHIRNMLMACRSGRYGKGSRDLFDDGE